jgi:hypothetical protein
MQNASRRWRASRKPDGEINGRIVLMERTVGLN